MSLRNRPTSVPFNPGLLVGAFIGSGVGFIVLYSMGYRGGDESSRIGITRFVCVFAGVGAFVWAWCRGAGSRVGSRQEEQADTDDPIESSTSSN